ncbi:hypothetical protein [Lactiplantibacillus plantarum]|uniref:hypothetical protein n=1 Tax=Lactiplantibacillus plantarum TaxID=1590 RepID=UPI001AAE2F2C|nr:hypothetical protein [Lactiplantibacillus plantarum]MBO2727154.1 hypothetical protein [Lactiplantibacillus plantarum]
MKQVFYYDQTSKQLTHIGIVDDNADLPDNATFVQPQNGMFDPLTWTGTDWVGVSQAEWENNQPAPVSATLTTEQKFQAQLALQMATMQEKQAEFNAQVLSQLANTTPVTSTAPTTSEASATSVTSEAPVTPVASATSEAPVTPVTSTTSAAAVTPTTSTTSTATTSAATENK